MTIKELFKKLEAANEFAKLVGGEEYYITLWDDNIIGEVSTYKEYRKVIKNVYTYEMVKPLLDYELVSNSSYIGDFICDYNITGVYGHTYKGTLQFEISKR